MEILFFTSLKEYLNYVMSSGEDPVQWLRELESTTEQFFTMALQSHFSQKCIPEVLEWYNANNYTTNY